MQQNMQFPIVQANIVVNDLNTHLMLIPKSIGTIYVVVNRDENLQGQFTRISVRESIDWLEGQHVYEIGNYSHAKSPI